MHRTSSRCLFRNIWSHAQYLRAKASSSCQPMCDKQVIFILLDQLSRSNAPERLMKGITRLQKTEQIHEESAFFSSLNRDWSRDHATSLCFRAAMKPPKKPFSFRRISVLLPRPFYSELHVYRMVYMLKKAGQLPAFIEEYIGPLVKYDTDKSGELLKTLKVYLTQYGSKQETATELLFVAANPLPSA